MAILRAARHRGCKGRLAGCSGRLRHQDIRKIVINIALRDITWPTGMAPGRASVICSLPKPVRY